MPILTLATIKTGTAPVDRWIVDVCAKFNTLARTVAGGAPPMSGGFSTVTASCSMPATAGIVLASATAAAITITLPPAASVSGQQFAFKKIDASANAVTIRAFGTETIDGANTKALAAQYDHTLIGSDGARWWVL